jgi:hypothetical protein
MPFAGFSTRIGHEFWRYGMSTVAASIEPRIQDAHVTEDEIVARLVDGRVISVPLAWSWRLSDATQQQRAHFRVIGSGQGIHWPDVDEDISVEGMLHGVPARRPKSKTSPESGKSARGQQPPNKRIQPTRGQRRVRAGGRGARG